MQKDDQLFMQLIYMFHTSAMQGLGKLPDPSGQVNRNLKYVSQTIDLMEMLELKTKGNISAEAKKLLGEMISELRINYLDEEKRLEVDEEVKKSDDK